MEKIVFACATHAVYLTAFVLFKVVGARLKRVSTRFPVLAVGELLSSATWVISLGVLISGTVVAYLAVEHAPLTLLLVSYLVGFPLMLLVSMWIFGERLNPQEWRVIGLVTAALVIIAFSSGLVGRGGLVLPSEADRTLTDPGLWRLGTVLVPSVLFPLWLFYVRDRKRDSRHGRPLTGVAHGIGAGVLLGTAEAFGLGIPSRLDDGYVELLTTPYLPIFLAAGALGLALLTAALQQCRLAIICITVNVIGKLQLLGAATLLYGEGWPDDRILFGVQCAGAALLLIAVFSLPHFERPAVAYKARTSKARAPKTVTPRPAELRPSAPPRGAPEPFLAAPVPAGTRPEPVRRTGAVPRHSSTGAYRVAREP